MSKPKKLNKNLEKIKQDRKGGQTAIRGFSFQCLFSCYKSLVYFDNDKKWLQFEGLEDIDSCFAENEFNLIQVKQSQNGQSANFMKSVLRNFLEVYLHEGNDEHCSFNLVYDFEVKEGNFKTLVKNGICKQNESFWSSVVEDIKEAKSSWNWYGFSFKDFFKRITFTKYSEDDLSKEIIEILISKFEINTGNENLYMTALHYFCFECMKSRKKIYSVDILNVIQNVKDDINKGSINIAYQWIKKEDLNNHGKADSHVSDYYSGKNATISDIVNGLPVERSYLEMKIIDSVFKHDITVIKASSGQGKSTLAYRTALRLKDTFSVYSISWCEEKSLIQNYIDFFKAKIRLGERLLIIIDNLDSSLKEWNSLVFQMKNQIMINYKILLTTREDDWYLFAGNQSNIRNMNIIDIKLNADEAEAIFGLLKQKGVIAEGINEWQSSWEKVSNRGLLLEYIYILTHGEMLSNRIENQMKRIGNSNIGNVICQILRQVCFADIIGIRVKVRNLLDNIKNTTMVDMGEILQSIENEFYIKIDINQVYVEGLHPVRSEHVTRILHRYYDIGDTISILSSMLDIKDVFKFFYLSPNYFGIEKEEIYQKILNYIELEDFKYLYQMAIGTMCYCIQDYFLYHKTDFDEIFEIGGLMFMETELSPFKEISPLNYKYSIFDDFSKFFKDNHNFMLIKKTCEKINKIDFFNTELNTLAQILEKKLKSMNKNIYDYDLQLLNRLYILCGLNNLFVDTNEIKIAITNFYDYPLKNTELLFFNYLLVDKSSFIEIIEENKEKILSYLKVETNSVFLEETREDNSITIKYILQPDKIASANNESVKRITSVCKMLPIYKIYKSEAIIPKLDCLSSIVLPHDDKKHMPLENVIIGFYSDLNKVWNQTIDRNYSCSSMYEWFFMWDKLRRLYVKFSEIAISIFSSVMNNQNLDKKIKQFDEVRGVIQTFKRKKFPVQSPNEEQDNIIEIDFKDSCDEYFNSFQNFINQFLNIFKKENENNAINQLIIASDQLEQMQQWFNEKIKDLIIYPFNLNELCTNEKRIFDLLDIAVYYLDHKRFTRYIAPMSRNWMKNKCYKEICGLNSIIEKETSGLFDLIYPLSHYRDENLLYYPVVVKNLSVSDNSLIILLSKMLSLINSKYHYLIILLSDDANNISMCIKITKSFLETLNDNLEGNIEGLPERVNPPMPLTEFEQFFGCFDEVLFVKTNSIKYEGIDIIYTLLWEYSQYGQYFNVDNTQEFEHLQRFYLQLQNEIETRIEACNILNIYPYKDKLLELKTKVFSENFVISNDFLNDLINKFIEISSL